jgi:hypothetical protein
MQIFLPYADIEQSARVLDTQRLMKQRVESYQILNTIQGKSTGWRSHPAVRMIKDYPAWLCLYSIKICQEARRRGYVDNLLPHFEKEILTYPYIIQPHWLGSYLHKTHQSNLIRKKPEFYGPKFPNIPDNLPYFWPPL